MSFNNICIISLTEIYTKPQAMRILYLLYQWLIAYPLLIIITFVISIIVVIGSIVGNRDFWGYYPPKIWAQCFCKLLLIRTEIRGKENIDDKTSYIFVANHQGAFDIFLIYGYLGHNFKWMMKKALKKIPFVGTACEYAGHIMVDRSSKGAIRRTMRQAEKTLQGGMSLVVFPEGSRCDDGRLHPFKRGAFLLAEEFSLPVVPLTIDGAFFLLPKNSINVHPGKVTLTIHKPITPPEGGKYDLDLLIKESYNNIASALPGEKPIE